MSCYNVQLPRFNSKFVSPGCWGVYAFAQDWNCEINWIFPPVCLIVRAVRELDSDMWDPVYTRMVVSIFLFFFSHSMTSLFKSFDKDVFVLPGIDNLLLKVQDKWKFTSPRIPYSVYVLRSGCWRCDCNLYSLFIPQWGVYLECLFQLGAFDLWVLPMEPFSAVFPAILAGKFD